MKTGRNEPCPCGSGKKFKQCCAPKGTQSYRLWNLGLLLLAVVFLAAAAMAVYSTSTAERVAPPGKVWSDEHGHWHDANPNAAPQPLGPAPEGKVWSEEHGHWHDANLNAAPQPLEPAPEGKVWSEEHGHWHDADASVDDLDADPTN